MICFDATSRPYRWQRRDRLLSLLCWACLLSVAGLGCVFYIFAR